MAHFSYLAFFSYPKWEITISRYLFAFDSLLGYYFIHIIATVLLSTLLPILGAKVACHHLSRVTKLAKIIAMCTIICFSSYFMNMIDIRKNYNEISKLDIDNMAQNLKTKEVQFFYQYTNPHSRASYYQSTYVLDVETQKNMIIGCSLSRVSLVCGELTSKELDGKKYHIKYHDLLNEKNQPVGRYLFEIIGMPNRDVTHYASIYKLQIQEKLVYIFFSLLIYLNNLGIVITFLRKG